MNKKSSQAATHLVCQGWGHCFFGTQETIVRWAFERATDRLVVQTKTATGWSNLEASAVSDVQADLYDNEALTDPELWDEITTETKWPAWAKAAICKKRATCV